MKAPKCRLCGAHHWSSEPHKFEIEPENVPTLKKKILSCVHNEDKPKSVCTQLREVSIRRFRSNMATELNNLPLSLVKNGKVVAIIRAK